MEVDEYMFDRPKRVVLDVTIAVLALSVVAVALTIAGFACQNVIGLRPTPRGNSTNSHQSVHVQTEGLFQICLSASDNQTGMCMTRSFGDYPKDSNLEYYPAFSEIVGYRLALVICLAAGLLFASLAATLSAIYLCAWYRAVQETMALLVSRLVIAIILFCSGTLYQLGIFFIHLSYVKEKTSYTDMIPYLFPLWPIDDKRNTEITYSFSYCFFWVSLICVHAAAIIYIATTVVTSQYYGEYDEHDTEVINYNTRNSLPRFSVHEESGVERIFLIDSP